jgi:PAS domain S-box-containing protein
MMTSQDRSPNSATAESSQSFYDWLVKSKSIVISILVLFILISSIVIALVYRQYKNAGADLLSADKTSANQIAGFIQEHNNAVLEVLASYARVPSFIDAAKKKDIVEARRQLALLKKNQDFNLALVTDKKGILWANFPAFPVGSNISYRDWYKGVSASWKPHVSGVFQIMTGDKPLVVAFSFPFFDEKGNPIGILTIYKKLDFITDSTKQASLDQLTTVNITDQGGNILFDTKSGFKKKATGYSLFPVIKKALTENKKQIEIQNQQTNQETSYLSIAEVKSTGWLVIVQRDLKGNLRPQQAKNPLALIIIFALLFIVLSLGLIYFRKIIVLKNTKEQLLSEIKLLEGEKIEWETRYYLENLVNYTNAPLIVWDHDLLIVRFDQAFEEMTGWSKAEVLGKKIDLLFPENSKKESLDYIITAAKSEKAEVLEVPILHKEGTIRTVLLNSTTIYDSDGKTAIATIAQGRDITDRKQVELEISKLNRKLEKRVLERTANLEAANRQLEAFSYSISQALLTPLQAIERLCDTLKENYQAKPDDTEKNYLEQMYKEIKRMGQLINDMMKLSRLNRTAINRQSVDVSKMAREITEAYRQKYPGRAVVVTVEKNILIDGDELLLKIALGNLIDNAWKFTAPKEHAVIKFGTTLKDGKTALFIKDNGVGFDVAHVSKLFNAFHRIDSTSDFPGTGIGLATVQRIVDRHGGEIWADGKPGKGATFYFTLS